MTQHFWHVQCLWPETAVQCQCQISFIPQWILMILFRFFFQGVVLFSSVLDNRDRNPVIAWCITVWNHIEIKKLKGIFVYCSTKVSFIILIRGICHGVKTNNKKEDKDHTNKLGPNWLCREIFLNCCIK